MNQDYIGAEWERILKLVTLFQSKPDKATILLPELPQSDQVKAFVAIACQFPPQESTKLLETVFDSCEPQLVIDALQILPREQLSKLVRQRFEGDPLSKAIGLIINSLSETELVLFASTSMLGEGKLRFMTFMFISLSAERREEIIKSIRKKEGFS